MRVFSYPPRGGSFSILWPKKSVSYGEQVTRDFFHEGNESQKMDYNPDWLILLSDLVGIANQRAPFFCRPLDARL